MLDVKLRASFEMGGAWVMYSHSPKLLLGEIDFFMGRYNHL